MIKDPRELKKRIEELRRIIESEVGDEVKIVELRKKINELSEEAERWK